MRGGRSRVLRPHQAWQTLDFALAVVAVCFLVYALWGASIAVAAASDMRALEVECADGACVHHGTVAERHFTSVGFPGVAYTAVPGMGGTYLCALSIQLDVGTLLAAITVDSCGQIEVGTVLDAKVWRGKVVTVLIGARAIGTYSHPATNLFLGLWKLPALIPFFALVGMIHIDIANHRYVRRIRRRSRAVS